MYVYVHVVHSYIHLLDLVQYVFLMYFFGVLYRDIV